MQPCQEKMSNRQVCIEVRYSEGLLAFGYIDLTSTNFRFEMCASLLLAAHEACSYTFLTKKQRIALKVSYDDMDFEAEIRALARRNVSAADSGVMSRCGPPSSSNPAINLRIIADRSKGG